MPARQHPEPTSLSKPTYWFNPTIGKHERRAADAAQQVQANDVGEAETPPAQANSPDAEDDDAEAEAQITRENRRTRTKEEVLMTRPEVRILDLHTKNPMVSYKDQIYSCSWAENIGTELLFTPHDDSSSLPILKALPGDVDLLAASSARLVSTAVKAERKDGVAAPIPEERPRVSLQSVNHFLAKKVGSRASPARRAQGKFLDSLIKMKLDKGETDRVTIIAQKRRTPREWKEDLRKRRNKERIKLRKDVRQGNGLEAELAKERLWEMEQEDEKMGKDEEKVSPEPEMKKRRVRTSILGGKGHQEGLDSPGPKGKGKEPMVMDGPALSDGMSPGAFGYEYDYDALTPEIPVFYGNEEGYQGQFNDQSSQLNDADADADAEGEEDDTQMYGGI